MKSFFLSSIAAVAFAQPSTPDVDVVIDWTQNIRTLKSVPAFQTVVNPMTTRASPIHDQVYNAIAKLGSEYNRGVPWLPYPKLGIIEMEPPSGSKLCGFVNSDGDNGVTFSTTLTCQNGGVINAIEFASYGNPTGYCGSLQYGTCNSPNSLSVVQSQCIGLPSCVIESNNDVFGGDPCFNTPKHLAIQATCSNGGNFTYYDFTWPDQFMVDFMEATGNGTRTAIPNFSTPPQWLYNTDRVLYPDDPLGIMWNYESSNTVVDKTYRTFGDYYGRLVAHYAEGGFYDEAMIFHPGFNFNITLWEVLNEVEGEHADTPAEYTQIYDAVVQGIQRFAPNAVKNNNMKFVGLALESDSDFKYATYFLNSSNHEAGVPVDVISFHFYASCANRDGGENASDYENFFTAADSFIQDAEEFIQIRDSSSYPNALIDADELGVILPDDNDSKWVSNDPGFPLIYWNAAAGLYAYEFGKLSVIGLDVVGMSQLVGYPQMNITRQDTGENYTLAPQFPSVAMLDWVSGGGTARYWVLKLVIDTLVPFVDQVINTTVPVVPPPGTNPFCGSIINLADLTLTCSDPGATINAIQFASYGTPTGTSCGNYAVNNTCNAANSTSVVESFCLGQNSCTIPADTPTFGDPCYGTVKHLVVQATCTGPNGGYQPPAGGSPVYAQAYLGGGYKKVLLVNKSSKYHLVQLPLEDFNKGGTWHVVDELTGFGPARIDMIPTNGLVQLAPFAVGFAITSQ